MNELVQICSECGMITITAIRSKRADLFDRVLEVVVATYTFPNKFFHKQFLNELFILIPYYVSDIATKKH